MKKYNVRVVADLTVERDGEEIKLVIEGEVEPYVRGYTSGPPEFCYPDEGGYAHIIEVKGDIDLSELTEEEKEEAQRLLYEAFEAEVEWAKEQAAEAEEAQRRGEW